MQSPSSVLFWGILAGLATNACSAAYWSTLGNTSRVTASVSSPGGIAWALTFNPQGSISSAKVITTPPLISLLLDPNSSAVTFNNAQASFFDSSAGVDAKGKAARNPLTDALGIGVSDLYFPFVAQLALKDRSTVPAAQTFTLNGLISQSLLDLTNPSSSDSIAIPTILAEVTLKGTNAMGQAITANVQVPLNVTVTR